MLEAARPRWRRLPGRLLQGLGVAGGSVSLTLALFLVLPLMQAIAKQPQPDLMVRSVDTGVLPPPPPPQDEPEKEPEPEEEPPELQEESEPLDLSELELALNAGLGSGWTTGDFSVKLGGSTGGSTGGGDDADALFSLAELDQRPRAIYQVGPVLTPDVREKAGDAWVLFVVDQEGRVEHAKIQHSDDPLFDKPSLDAVRKWKFEPGKRNGQPVKFRMRVKLTFPGR